MSACPEKKAFLYGLAHIVDKQNWFNTYHTMGKFSKWQTVYIFLFFLENKIRHFMQTVS